jgi:hypothetical protein
MDEYLPRDFSVEGLLSMSASIGSGGEKCQLLCISTSTIKGSKISALHSGQLSHVARTCPFSGAIVVYGEQ